MDEYDDTRAARGIGIGICIGVAMWTAIGLVAWVVWAVVR